MPLEYAYRPEVNFAIFGKSLWPINKLKEFILFYVVEIKYFVEFF